jgi:hypothetical protein
MREKKETNRGALHVQGFGCLQAKTPATQDSAWSQDIPARSFRQHCFQPQTALAHHQEVLIKMGKGNTMHYLMGLIALILISTASWALYDIVTKGTNDLMTWLATKFNLPFLLNTYAQGTVVIMLVLLLLIGIWKFRLKRIMENIVR